MFQPWRLKLRAAEEAFRRGQLDEAGRLLSEDEVREFLPAKKLLAQVADRLAVRGQEHLERDESSASWRDLEKAIQLGADQETVGALRRLLVDRAVAEAESLLAAGDFTAAVARLDRLRRRHGTNSAARTLEQAATKAETAQRLARRGEFAEAEPLLTAASALAPQCEGIARALATCQVRMAESRRLVETIHDALRADDWTRALAAAEALLELAPAHPLALHARGRAWEAVGMGSVQMRRARSGSAAVVNAHRVTNGQSMKKSINPLNISAEPAASEVNVRGPRFSLWVDGVGGYLVCLGEEVTLGQPVPGNDVDVPILADISRDHARIRRDGEGYLIEPLRDVKLNGRTLTKVGSLTDGAVIELGSGVRIRFRRPHALSATARLEFISRHKTQPSADAVLLMGESCILGPGPTSHVVAPDWTHDVVIYRREDELACRAPGTIEVDGAAHDGRATITRTSQVTGDDFSFTLEEN